MCRHFNIYFSYCYIYFIYFILLLLFLFLLQTISKGILQQQRKSLHHFQPTCLHKVLLHYRTETLTEFVNAEVVPPGTAVLTLAVEHVAEVQGDLVPLESISVVHTHEALQAEAVIGTRGEGGENMKSFILPRLLRTTY